MSLILIVEDDDASRDMLERRIRRWGYETVSAKDGFAALDQVEATMPNLILMDIGLPGINGLELIRHLKASSQTRHIPIIALTAYTYEDDQNACFEAGCDDFGIKPIDMDYLLEKIQHWMS